MRVIDVVRTKCRRCGIKRDSFEIDKRGFCKDRTDCFFTKRCPVCRHYFKAKMGCKKYCSPKCRAKFIGTDIKKYEISYEKVKKEQKDITKLIHDLPKKEYIKTKCDMTRDFFNRLGYDFDNLVVEEHKRQYKNIYK